MLQTLFLREFNNYKRRGGSFSRAEYEKVIMGMKAELPGYVLHHYFCRLYRLTAGVPLSCSDPDVGLVARISESLGKSIDDRDALMLVLREAYMLQNKPEGEMKEKYSLIYNPNLIYD